MSYFEQTKVTDSTGAVVNPATEESVLLLRRMVKLLESNAVVDIQNRQRVTIDAVPSVINTVGVALAVGPDTPTVSAPSNTTSIYWQPVWIGPVDQRFQIMDAARLNYDNSIRSHLTFS